MLNYYISYHKKKYIQLKVLWWLLFFYQQLALKHRQSKNHKMRIVAFVGSPIEADEKEIIKVAKRLKKEKVNIDIVNFGETVSKQ